MSDSTTLKNPNIASDTSSTLSPSAQLIRAPQPGTKRGSSALINVSAMTIGTALPLRAATVSTAR